MHRLLFLAVVVVSLCGSAAAQQAPAIGYMFPPGAQSGKTVEVTLGGYDWTPDMQVFVHNPRIRLEIIGEPGPVIVPEPPYWFGKKARRPPFLLPRETKARLTIPADVAPGKVVWQAANANGATSVGYFVVGADREVVEDENRTAHQQLGTLPVVVSARIKKIEEVDRFEFSVSRTGPVSCSVCAREFGSIFTPAVEIYDAKGNRVADAADTAGNDTAITFAGQAGMNYTAHVYDVDFRGNRAFVYRLHIAEAPRVVAAIPPIGRRGQTREVELVGYGVASGNPQLESVTRKVAFPADKNSDSFRYALDTPFGQAASIELHVSDSVQTLRKSTGVAELANLPAAVTGVLEDRFGEHRYRVSAQKGDVLDVAVSAAKFKSGLDVSLAVYNAEGKQLAQNDDLPLTTDAGLQFRVSADGEYQVGVSDVSGQSGNRSAVYHLTVEPSKPGFSFTVPDRLSAPIGGTAKLALKATRTGGFKDPVSISFSGLPAGISVPEELVLPAGKTALSVELNVSETAAATASLTTITGKATIDERMVEFTTGPILVAATITPPFTVDAEGKDDVTKWPRGTIFPAPALIEREDGFNEDIVLVMASKQGRHRQGITGPELTVPPSVSRVLYPVTLPEWLETTRTSRMVVNGVAKVKDPQGNVRYSVSRQKTRMGFLPTGALLKLSADLTEFTAAPGESLSVPLSISRSQQLTGATVLELRQDEEQKPLFSAQAQTLAADQTQLTFSILVPADAQPGSEHELTIRATVLDASNLPVVSETTVLLQTPTKN